MAEEVVAFPVLQSRDFCFLGRHAVGTISGLLLAVKDSGAKSWILRTVIGGKRRNIGLGSYPEVPLAEAKERARDAKEKIRRGIAPVEERRATRRALHEQSERMTFCECEAHQIALRRDRLHSGLVYYSVFLCSHHYLHLRLTCQKRKFAGS